MSAQNMNIGTVAEASGVPPKSIRYYESIGLIDAAQRRSNGYRNYSPLDMQTLAFIKRARGLGFSVEEVRQLLDLWRNKGRKSDTVRKLALQHVDALDRKIGELRAMRKAISDLIRRCHGDSRPDCPIIEDLEDRPRRSA
jgi:MerR family transcriptional regulator, copper efflux regulator